MASFVWRIAVVMALSLAALSAGAADPALLRVKVFPGAQLLPLWAGMAKGLFRKHGIELDLQYTQSSVELRQGLASGAFEIVHSGVDNAVAMVEADARDVVIVLGGDSSMNELYVQPDIGSVAELRGRILIVDAPNTSFALLAKKILLNHGLKDGRDYTIKSIGGTAQRAKAMSENKDYAASTLFPPFSVEAAKRGLKSLGRTIDLLGPYQSTGGFVLRAWASANSAVLERYIAAYIESQRWVLAPANRPECVAILIDRLKIPPEVAERSYELLADPQFGLAPEARFNLEGFRNLLALRAELEGQWGGIAPAPERYLDLSYYERAARRLAR